MQISIVSENTLIYIKKINQCKQKNNQTIGYFEINAYFCAKYRKSLI